MLYTRFVSTRDAFFVDGKFPWFSLVFPTSLSPQDLLLNVCSKIDNLHWILSSSQNFFPFSASKVSLWKVTLRKLWQQGSSTAIMEMCCFRQKTFYALTALPVSMLFLVSMRETVFSRHWMSALESFINLCKSAPERFKISFTDFMSAEIKRIFKNTFGWITVLHRKVFPVSNSHLLRFIYAAFL